MHNNYFETKNKEIEKCNKIIFDKMNNFGNHLKQISDCLEVEFVEK